MKLLPVLILLGCIATMQGASAQGVAGAQGPRGVCAPSNAERATIAAVSADPTAWIGRCVSVTGIYSNERIYADVDAIYGVNKSSIGGYVDGKGSMEGFWKGEFAGRVTDCASAQADLDTGLLRSPGISLDDRVLGCRTPEGPFLLFLSPHGLELAQVTRRLRAEAGPNGGDLEPAPKNWPALTVVQKLAADFLAALRANDKSALTSFIKSPYAVDRLVDDRESAIADLRKSAERQVQVFLHRPSTTDANHFSAETCFCRSKDCSKLWPIARLDADNQSMRPYACMRIDGLRADGGAWVYDVDPSRDYDGLPEP